MRLGIVLEIPSSLSESTTPALTLPSDDCPMSFVAFPCQGQSLHAGLELAIINRRKRELNYQHRRLEDTDHHTRRRPASRSCAEPAAAPVLSAARSGGRERRQQDQPQRRRVRQLRRLRQLRQHLRFHCLPGQQEPLAGSGLSHALTGRGSRPGIQWITGAASAVNKASCFIG